jgi:tetratricopeptide (TPR) repeat protein
MDKAPETIGKYRILRVLGRGGMGTVYEGLDPLLNRKVALKTMIPGLAENEELRARFMREAQAAGGLRHRNIITVYEMWEDHGQPYIAMEFLEGSDLEKLMHQPAALSTERKLDVIRQICEGLACAHKAGIVHRDVKPANIRITPEGDVKIMDFGIAHLQSSTMTKSGLVLGTVHYMAPEQLAGGKVDHRADIFSVGVIAFELLAGRKPFDGDTLTAVMYKVMHETPDTGWLPRTSFSPGLDRIVLKALQRELGQRYATLDDMHADLSTLVREVGQKARAHQGDEEALRGRVERELREIRQAAHQARGEGQLQKALALVRKLVELDPDDLQAAREAQELEAAIQERQVEQLCGVALSYAAEGETELALKIAARIERLAPHSARFIQLRGYLAEESARRTADVLAATAQDHLGLGNLAEARAAAEEALAALPTHTLAREIRDRAAAVLAVQEQHAARNTPAADPEQTVILTRQPEPVVATPAIATPPATPPPPAAAPPPGTAATDATQVVAPHPNRVPVPEPAATVLLRPAVAASSAAQEPPGPRTAARGPVTLTPPPTNAPSQAERARGIGPPQSDTQPMRLGRDIPRADAPKATAAAVPPSRPTSVPAPAGDPETVRLPLPTPARAAGAAVRPSAPAATPPAPPSAAAVATPATPRREPMPAPSTTPPPAALTPLPEGAPQDSEAARLLEEARLALRERQPGKALTLLEQAATREPAHVGIQRLLTVTRNDARRAEIESLTTAALDHFVANRYAKARAAVEKALALDPGNKKAKDLLKILGPLA